MHLLITGGAGFIGCNATAFFLDQGHTITIFDNLSREGTARNLAWLRTLPGAARLRFIRGDIRDAASVHAAVAGGTPIDVVLHLAGQVAVTLSVADPRADFEINALGTLNVLEAVRLAAPEAIVLNASTNKVYGKLDHLNIVEREASWAYADQPYGVSEREPLDFHSPYGCSKGAADQYVVDYARIYGLRTLNFRQSCIYGPRQFGVEDQGWVAHFVIAAVMDRPITIYGDGKQVRDVLHVTDLLRAYAAGIDRIERVAGETFNVGGGPANTLAIWTEFGPLLHSLKGQPVPVTRGPWRPGDQRVFISDIRRARERLGWAPRVAPAEGIADLYRWVTENRALFEATPA